MLTNRSALRTAGPTIAVALVLLGACIAAAVFLQREQSRTAGLLREDVRSRTVAQNLEIALEDLLALLSHGSPQVDGLNERAQGWLREAQALADKDEERWLVTQLQASFTAYLGAGQRLPAALSILETQTLPLARQLRQYNGTQIIQSEELHAQTVRGMAWGLAGVGLVGALGGIVFGYGVARSVSRAIYQIRVRIQDAADRLGQNLPTVTLTQEADFPQLHGQMEQLVHEIEKVVEQLQQREREVLRAEQMGAVGQLAAGTAHELRNPLTAIKMLVQTQREEALERGQPTEDLDIIAGEVRRMERCLHTFLDFARLPNPERRRLELTPVVEKALALLGGRARHQSVALGFRPPGQPLVVEADPEQVHQVLVNLLLNALDVLPDGGTVEIELGTTSRNQVALRVRDTGPGIAADLMPRLFEPFVSSKETGLGLGLVVSRRIAEAHGGSLGVVNRPEGGACFELRLPCAGGHC